MSSARAWAARIRLKRSRWSPARRPARRAWEISMGEQGVAGLLDGVDEVALERAASGSLPRRTFVAIS